MEVTKGYKQTEVGIIPNDWSIKPIGEVFSITAGGDFQQSTFSEVQDDIYCFPIYSNALTNKGLYGYSSQYKNDEETITVTARGEVGNANPRFTKYTAIGRVLSLKPKEEIDSFFLAECINQLVNFANESTGVPQLTAPQISKYLLPIPTLAEQTAIATALSDTDALITSLEKLIAKKRKIKQGAMQQLLTGKKRLPGFSGKWEVKKLGELCSLINGRAYKLSEWETNGTPVIRLQNLTGSGIDYYFSNLILPEKQYCKKGNLLFMWSATFGPYIWQGDKAIYHYHIWKVECEEKIMDQQYLYYSLDDLTNQLKSSSSSGGTMLHVTKEKMEKTEIIIPPSLIEQTAIAQILSDMDAEIESLERKLEKYKFIKQGMMQELLTGKTRLA